MLRSDIDFLTNEEYENLLQQYEDFKHFNETKVKYQNQLQGKTMYITNTYSIEEFLILNRIYFQLLNLRPTSSL